MKRLALFALALSLTACATVERFGAAADIHDFLVAIRDGDRARFDAHVDKPALKAQLKARLMAGMLEHRDSSGLAGALGAMLGGPAVDFAVDNLARPEVFLASAEAKGYSPDKPLPGVAVIASSVRALDADRACVTTKRDGPCTLVFRNEDGVWKLVAFEGDVGELRFK